MTKSPKTEQPGSAAGDRADAEDAAPALTRMVDETGKSGEYGRSLAAINKALDGLAGTMDTIGQELAVLRADPGGGAAHAAAHAAAEGELRKVAEEIKGHVRVCVADFHRWQETARRATGRLALALAVAAPPVLLSFGMVAQQSWELLPRHDPTGGWKDYVWERYGGRLVDCTRRAEERGGRLVCEIATSVR